MTIIARPGRMSADDDLVPEPHEPVDPQIVDLIDLAARTLPVLPDPSPDDRRSLADMVAPLFRGPFRQGDVPAVETLDRMVTSKDGTRVSVRLYQPRKEASPATVLFIHGGGWVAGSVASYEPDVLRFVGATGMSVASVEYRLSPEHRRPAALEDCLAAARMLVDTGEASPLAIVGDSAGGNLALECAISLRHEDVRLAAQLLFYPAVDPAAQDNQSYRENGHGYLLTSEDMAYYWSAYLGPEDRGAIAGYAPFARERLAGLPPTVLVTAGFDPLRDEGRQLAIDLIHADVPVTYLPNPTLTHGFQQMVPRVAAATEAVGAAYAAFRRLVADRTAVSTHRPAPVL
jgi:acetyl esterase